jgi:hypothetical protein
MHHRMLEWLQEILLEFKTGEFLLFQEAHGELPQRVQCKVADMSIAVAANLCMGLSIYLGVLKRILPD